MPFGFGALLHCEFNGMNMKINKLMHFCFLEKFIVENYHSTAFLPNHKLTYSNDIKETTLLSKWLGYHMALMLV